MFTKSVSIVCGTVVLALSQSLMATTITAIDGSQGWGNWDTRSGGTAAITDLGGRDALVISTDSSLPGGSSQAKAAYYGGSIGGLGQLGQLTSLSFDWYRDSASTDSNTRQLPGLRLIVQNSVGDVGQLVWEWAENSGVAAVEDTWVTQDLLGSAENRFWVYSEGHNFFNPPTSVNDGTVPGTPGSYRQTLAFYTGGGTITDGSNNTVLFGEDSTVLGAIVSMGSGVNGYYRGGVDNIHFGFTDPAGGPEQVINYDFETSAVSNPVPEPATAAMGLLALGGLMVSARRRRA